MARNTRAPLLVAATVLALLATRAAPVRAVMVDPTDLRGAAEGMEDLEKARPAVPAGAPEARDLGEALDLLNAGKVDASIEKVRKVLGAAPRSAAGREILGAALALKGDAEGALREAVAIEPKRSTAITKIGDVYLAQGKLAEAKKEFLRAEELSPGDRLVHQDGWQDAKGKKRRHRPLSRCPAVDHPGSLGSGESDRASVPSSGNDHSTAEVDPGNRWKPLYSQ